MDPLVALIQALIPPTPAADDGLLVALRPHVDDEMLDDIARADYGMEADAHLRELRAIRDDGTVPAPMDWVPREVLSLVRWTEPGDPNQSLWDHHRLAFVCAALLRADAEPANHATLISEVDSLAGLLDSAIVLGGPILDAALPFLAWRVAHPAEDTERPFFAFGVLLLAVLRRQRYAEERIGELAVAVIDEEARVRQRHLLHGAPGFLTGLTNYNQKIATWQRLGRRLAAEARDFADPTARGWLAEIGDALARGY